MQTRSTQFDILASGDVRPLSWGFRVSFDKQFDEDVTFFTLDQSVLNGVDVLAPSESNVIQEWDKYDYANYDERVVSMEWQREEIVPYSVTLAMADITLNNYDKFFTRGSGSPIEAGLLPRRPVRILSGFNGENIPKFVGLSTKVPETDSGSRTANIHAEDFLSFIFTRTLSEDTLLVEKKTHEILEYLFDLVGLVPDQYELDESFNTVAFVYWPKGASMGDIVRELMQAELGTLYMDEAGKIRFKNRFKATASSVMDFNEDNIIEYKILNDDTIINSVDIKAEVREVQPTQPVYNLAGPFEIPGDSTVSRFFDFQDPVLEILDIVNFKATANQDGSGTDLTANITATYDLFATSIKVDFTNSSSTKAWMTELIIFGSPAQVVRNIDYSAKDEPSIDRFEEQHIEIQNNFIQTEDAAASVALSLISYYNNYANTIELNVKGSPALQLGDTIGVNVDTIDENYIIIKIQEVLSGGQYQQRITGRVFNTPAFFTLSSDSVTMSLLNGDDVLAI